jgi:hypothetical protein
VIPTIWERGVSMARTKVKGKAAAAFLPSAGVTQP